MKYYKIKDGNTVIDVNDVFLNFQEKHGILTVCEAEQAQFIQTSDALGVYHVPWLNKVPEAYGEYETIEAVEIEEEEYKSLKEQLGSGEVQEEAPAEEETEKQEQEPEKEEEKEQVLSMAELYRELSAVRESNKELTERNEMLEECLLELSEIVYQ